MEARVSILSDIACELGEGPSYDPRTDTLWWFDIVRCRLLEHPFRKGETTVHELPVMASAIAFTAEGGQVIATERGVERRDPTTGRLELLAEIEADNPANRSNDARVHQSGAFWIGTMAKQSGGAGAIYHYAAGKVTRLFPDITIPNSICFSPAGDIAYFADTRRNLLYRVDCNPFTGMPTGEPKILLDHRGKPGGIDGSVCDAEGTIWNARWGSARVDAYAPDGTHLRSVDLPASRTSCPAFVGRNADRLAVTSALQGMSAEERAADPDGGKTFLVELPVRGRHDPFVRV